MGFKQRFGVPYGILANKNHPPTNTPAIQHSWKKKQTKNDKIYLIYIGVIIMIRLHAVPAGHPCKSPARQLGPVVYHITPYPGQVSNSSLFLLHNYIWGATCFIMSYVCISFTKSSNKLPWKHWIPRYADPTRPSNFHQRHLAVSMRTCRHFTWDSHVVAAFFSSIRKFIEEWDSHWDGLRRILIYTV